MLKNWWEKTDFRDAGSFVIVENVEKIAVTGKKLTDKVYYSYSGYKGNLKSITLGELLKKNPGKALWYAVRGMLPKNRLGRTILKNLHVYEGSEHKHEAQQPKVINLNEIK